MVTRRAGSTASGTLLKLLALLVTLGLVAAACGGSDDEGGDGNAAEGTDEGEDGGLATDTTEAPEENAGEPQQGGAITVGLEAETSGWRPGTGNWASSGFNVAFTLMDPLMALTEDGSTVVPYLAESLEANDDATEFTLTLRPDVTFHDGTPLDAQAIKDNFDIYLKADTSNVKGVLADVTAFEVTGELTGVYKLAKANVAFPDLLTGSPGMPFSPTAAEEMGDAFSDNPVGAGPYKFVSWARDDRLVVERYEDYWGTPGYLDQITFRPIPDEDSRLQSLLSGDIDAFITLRQSIVSQALEAEEQGTIKATLFAGNNGGGAIFNTLAPPVDDQRVRLGLAHGINQADLVEVLGGADVSPLQTQFFAEKSPFYSEKVAEAFPTYDAEKAQGLLDEYINDPERSDGKAVGDPIAVEFNCPPDPSLIELSQAYQAFWQAIGVDVKLNSVEQATHILNALTDKFVINCWRQGGEGDPYPELSNAFGPVKDQPLNFTNFTSPTIDEQLEILRQSTDLDERKAAVEAIGLELDEQVPYLWTGSTAVLIGSTPVINNIAGWTNPGGEKGNGIADAVTRWSQVWMEQ